MLMSGEVHICGVLNVTGLGVVTASGTDRITAGRKEAPLVRVCGGG